MITPQALRLEGHQVDPPDRVPGRRPARVLGSARLLQHRRAVARRPLRRLSRRSHRAIAAETDAVFSAQDLRPMLAVAPDAPPPLGRRAPGLRAEVRRHPRHRPGRARHRRRTCGMWSRNGNEKSRQFPELVAALSAWAGTLAAPVVLDGEIVALDGRGRPGRLPAPAGPHQRVGPGLSLVGAGTDAGRAADGARRLRPAARRRRGLAAQAAARARRAALEARVRDMGSPRCASAEQVAADGHALCTPARSDEGWEGLLVKVADSPYRAGKRSARVAQVQDSAAGRVRRRRLDRAARRAPRFRRLDPRRARDADGTLDLRRRRRHRFQRRRARSRVRDARDAGHRHAARSPRRPRRRARPTGCGPRLVAQVRYTEMTDEGRLRHPAYLGLRDDKAARAVTMPANAERRGGPHRRT